MENRNKRIIFVLGMHRSGTSLVTQLIGKMGAYIGDEKTLLDSNEFNPDGFFENKEIVEIEDQILRGFGLEWRDISYIEEKWFLSKHIENYRKRIKRVIRNLYYNASSAIPVIKDPRMALLLPLWKEVCLEMNLSPLYVVIYRNPYDVAESLQKRDNMKLNEGMELWCHYNAQILNHLKYEKAIYLSFNDLLDYTEDVVDRLNNYVFHSSFYNWESLSGIIKKDLRHHFTKDMDNSPIQEFRVLYRLMQELSQEQKELLIEGRQIEMLNRFMYHFYAENKCRCIKRSIRRYSKKIYYLIHKQSDII